MATGYNRRPFLPEWKGRDGYAGEIVHAASYRSPAPYRGRHVLVIGAGNSGAEIAVDLVEGGAGSVRLSVRTPPQIFLKRRELEVVPGVRAFDETTVLLTDGGRVTDDVVISATGYRRDLEPLVGHLGVLGPNGRPTVHGASTHPAAPGLYFVGFTHSDAVTMLQRKIRPP